MIVGIIGTRGIPNLYGGFERFVELLVCDEIFDGRVKFKVYGETEDLYYNERCDVRWVGFCKNKNPLRYYIESTILATKECDVILCCGVGISIFAAWPRIFGKKIIVNPDGCEWKRTKWSKYGRLIIKAMYWPAMFFANKIVIDAEALAEDFGLLDNKYTYIGYQAPESNIYPQNMDFVEKNSLQDGYALVIARLEPENNIKMIVDAFSNDINKNKTLIIVGSTDTKFYKKVIDGNLCDNIKFVGAIYDQDVLNGLRSGCSMYIHGHSVGGTNPSLLEALSTVGGHMICHRNKYNKEVAGNDAEYFEDSKELSDIVASLSFSGPTARLPKRDIRFDPKNISQKYLNLFTSV